VLDLLVRGGTLLDGTGAPRRGADVGVREGRVVAVAPAGRLDEPARRTLDAGGLGFSSSHAPTHHDGEGRPVPSRAAGREELLALCAEVGRHPGTTLEFIPTVGPFADEHVALMTDMSRTADRPLNWNVLVVNARRPALHEAQLAASDRAAERGGRLVALTPPLAMNVRLNFTSGMVLDALPGWAPLFGLPLAERAESLRSPEWRARLAEGAANSQAGPLKAIARFERMLVAETFRPENAPARGRTLGGLAREQGTTPLEAMLDLALSDEIRTSFSPALPPEDRETWAARAAVWRDPRALPGASDAGAHLDMIDTFAYTTVLLGLGVRENEALSWEEAVRLLTSAPADLYGLRDRGRVAPGAWADLVLFDPDRIGPGPVHTRADLPAGASRLYAEAEGIERVLVAGEEVVAEGCFGEPRPGRVLRSGRDTVTVSARGGPA